MKVLEERVCSLHIWQGLQRQQWVRSRSWQWHAMRCFPRTWKCTTRRPSYTRQWCRSGMEVPGSLTPSPTCWNFTATATGHHARRAGEAPALDPSSWTPVWSTVIPSHTHRHQPLWARWRLRSLQRWAYWQKASMWNRCCSFLWMTRVVWEVNRGWQCSYVLIQQVPKHFSRDLGQGRQKHLSTRLLWTKQAMMRQWFEVFKISTKESPADLNTKALSRERREFLMKRIGLVSEVFGEDEEVPYQGRKKKLVKLLVNMIMASNLQGCGEETLAWTRPTSTGEKRWDWVPNNKTAFEVGNVCDSLHGHCDASNLLQADRGDGGDRVCCPGRSAILWRIGWRPVCWEPWRRRAKSSWDRGRWWSRRYNECNGVDLDRKYQWSCGSCWNSTPSSSSWRSTWL